MRRLVPILLLMASTVFCWSAHEVLTYLVVKDFLPNAEKLIQITPYTYQENRVYNTDYLRLEDYCGEFIQQFVPKTATFYPPDPEPIDNKVYLWQVLTIYSVEPDLGMDEGLNLSPLQSIIGNSQGVRHMKYRLLFLDFFEGSDSFRYFVKMSREAFKKGDEYWGYRFLARALHHLEDLSMPFHNTPGTFFDTMKALFDKQTATYLSNLHYSYDDYLAYLLYNADEDIVKAIASAQPKDSRHIRQLIQRVRLLGLNNVGIVSKIFNESFSQELQTRTVGFEDFKAKESQLNELKKVTIQIIAEFSSLARAFLMDFLKEVGQL
ncbi:hypothetical protein ACSFC1_04130 [Pseudothermotoga sp. U03pept]|uniref:hypothetical protein n=1 Tax=Pseudothermotoga sp. U03pept TaxID=3447012 RepID=UPI003EFE9AE1